MDTWQSEDQVTSEDLTKGGLKDMVYFMLTFLPFRKAGEHQILRCQWFAVKCYGFTIDALTLKPSDFCNTGVKSDRS